MNWSMRRDISMKKKNESKRCAIKSRPGAEMENGVNVCTAAHHKQTGKWESRKNVGSKWKRGRSHGKDVNITTVRSHAQGLLSKVSSSSHGLGAVVTRVERHLYPEERH